MGYNYNYEGGTYVAATDNSSWKRSFPISIDCDDRDNC